MARKPKKPATEEVTIEEPVPERHQLLQWWDRCKQITLYQFAVTAISIVSALGPAYLAMKSIAARAAENYIQLVVEKKGLKIDDVQKGLKKIEEIDKLKQEQLTIQSDLATVKDQGRRNEELLKQLLELEIGNQR